VSDAPAPRAGSRPAGLLRPYLEKETLAAFFVGVSSGFPYAMIGATLTTRLAQDGIDKRTVTAFTLAFLVYNLKVLWAWVVDGVHIPLLGRLGQRVSWLLLAGHAVIAAVVNLALVDPSASIQATVIAAVLVGIAGATYDIVIDAYRIETLKPRQLGVGSGMSQYGWRIGSAAAGALALVHGGTLRLGRRLHRLRGVCAAGDAHRPDRRRAGAASSSRTRSAASRPSGIRSSGRSSSSCVAAAPGSCCCSSSCTRSATRSRT
jgi:hypothetical protein